MQEPNKSADDKPIRDWRGRFTKGSPGLNKGGRPKGSISLVRLLRERLKENPLEADAIVEALVKLSKGRELAAIKEILDRIDGKVTDTHRIEGDVPIQLVFMPAQELLAREAGDTQE